MYVEWTFRTEAWRFLLLGFFYGMISSWIILLLLIMLPTGIRILLLTSGFYCPLLLWNCCNLFYSLNYVFWNFYVILI